MAYPIRINYCDKEYGNLHFVLGIESVLEYAENLQVVDAEPVRHGKWVEAYKGLSSCKCSVCNAVYETETNYCPKCGAKMDGD